MFWNRQRVNWEDFNSGPRGMDPLLVSKWLDLSEKESYNIVAKMAGLKKFAIGTELIPTDIIPSPININRKHINKKTNRLDKLN